ncbi:unnamed protein product [Oreochromis niloticus]|nr:unnamed protein product [Mustela putorius furo]
MKPLTAALDILQGDCPYGTLLPTLEVLMQKTQAVKDDLSRMIAGLPDAIVQATQTRFVGVLDDKDALLAAASCPKFKLRWLRDAGRRERVKQLLCCTTAPVGKNPASVPSATTSSSQGEMDFFTFEAEPEEETYSAEKEVMDYLRNRRLDGPLGPSSGGRWLWLDGPLGPSSGDEQGLAQFSRTPSGNRRLNGPLGPSSGGRWLWLDGPLGPSSGDEQRLVRFSRTPSGNRRLDGPLGPSSGDEQRLVRFSRTPSGNRRLGS